MRAIFFLFFFLFCKTVYGALVTLTDITYASVSSNKVIKSLLADAEIHIDLKLLDIKINKKLKLDIYKDDQDIQLKPLIIFLHGGAFVMGDKKSESVVYLCEAFAEKGYITASIDYRKLGFGYLSLPKAGYAAMQDARAAVRFLRASASEYGIDASQIFIGGISAGGFTALNVAYYDEGEVLPFSTSQIDDIFGCLDCIGDYQNVSSEVKGVINIVGGVYAPLMLNNKVPAVCFHGDLDKVVSPIHEYPFQPFSDLFNAAIDQLIIWFKHTKYIDLIREKAELFLDFRKVPKVYGSYEIHRLLKQKNIKSKLYRFKSAGHSLITADGKVLKTAEHVVDGITSFLKSNSTLNAYH